MSVLLELFQKKKERKPHFNVNLILRGQHYPDTKASQGHYKKWKKKKKKKKKSRLIENKLVVPSGGNGAMYGWDSESTKYWM